MIDKKLLKNIDYTLIITIIAIFCIGLVMISSATHVTQDGLTRQVKVQAIAFALGFVSILIILLIDYNFYGSFDKGIYVVSVLFLLAVYIPGIGKSLGGARSWIDLGPIDFQPVEIVKIGFILSFAKYLESRQNQLNSIKDLIPIAIYGGIPILLLLKQPDLGSSLVFIVIILGMSFASGLSYKILGMGFLTGVVSLPIAYKLMAPHQRIRIDAFLKPSDMSLPGNYHVMQSKIAIGSGQAIGKGLYQGTQNNFDFLPVQETDFIFAVLGEEFGFVGGTVVIILYFIFLYRMMKIAMASKDIYGSLVVVGITSMFAFQIFENIGMTMGTMPVTGLTLPFISYGGSSLITSMLAVGIVLNIGMRRQKIKF
ncbi:rod shape-determining protein RodA [Anaerosolibacter sp.]|jgi:rod shape determining protein RodA|uniref:rod shape-determining protein RodA n=1 Tax=Anaerosolibacter sp. TaxID=1872527 RepID=UPI00262DC19A|nr:rod shape-determining protein RodA [Anaerosolibacter sp.]MDF2547047.1 rodA [Anaerosolibacter sp.]